MRIDGITLLDDEAKKFLDILGCYNTKLTPSDPYTREELASQLLSDAIKEKWFRLRKEGKL